MLVAGVAEPGVQALVLGLMANMLEPDEVVDTAVELALAKRGIRELDEEELLVMEIALELGVAEAGPMLLGDAEDEEAVLEVLEEDAADELTVLLVDDAAVLDIELLDDVCIAELELEVLDDELLDDVDMADLELALLDAELLLLELAPAEELLKLLLVALDDVIDPPYTGGSPTDEDETADEELELELAVELIIDELELAATTR